MGPWDARGRTQAAQALHADVDAVGAERGRGAGRGRLGARKRQPQHVSQRVQPLPARARSGGQTETRNMDGLRFGRQAKGFNK